MSTWREVKNFASQKFRLTPDLDSIILEQERSLKKWLRPPWVSSTEHYLTSCFSVVVHPGFAVYCGMVLPGWLAH